MITILPKPVPCVTPMGEGWIFYIKDNGMYENDEFTIVLFKDGEIRHFTSDQVKIWQNATYGIQKPMNAEEILRGPKNIFQGGPY